MQIAGCIVAPRAKDVQQPFWPLQRLTRQRMAVHFDRAAIAWDIFKDPQATDAEVDRAGKIYESALATVLKYWGRSQLPRKWKNDSVFGPDGKSYQVHLLPAPGGVEEVSPLTLDRLIVADQVPMGLGTRTFVEEGVGVPVVGQIQYSKTRAAKDPMLPINGTFLTLTAVLEFDPVQPGQPRQCHLRFYNPLRKPEAELAGQKVPLAANFTAPKKMALHDGFYRPFSRVGLYYPGNMLDQSRLYRLEPYDPKRIPVVFVHGMLSDPQIWFHCINTLYSDPVLRANYQPWYFMYPSGLPVPSTSWRLRECLQQARAALDPDGNDPGMNRMVLVGHSMGGLLARMQTIDSGDDFWNAYFNRPADKLHVSKATAQWLQETLYFKKQPAIKRLIFIAVPHHGSDIADQRVINRLSPFIRLPAATLLLSKEILTGNTDALSPQLRDWGSYGFLGLGTVSPKHPYLKALNSQPIPVPHHSIIMRTGDKDTPLEKSSDLVVRYSSSHLSTGTEVVVPHWHGAVEKHEVSEEISRRLHQHLKENGLP